MCTMSNGKPLWARPKLAVLPIEFCALGLAASQMPMSDNEAQRGAGSNDSINRHIYAQLCVRDILGSKVSRSSRPVSAGQTLWVSLFTRQGYQIPAGQ